MFSPLLTAGAFICLAKTVDSGRGARKMWPIILVTLVAGILLSYSTLNALAASFGVFVFVLGLMMSGMIRFRRVIAVLVLFALGAVSVTLGTALAMGGYELLRLYSIRPFLRLFDPTDFSAVYRFSVIPAGLEVFRENWAFGVGTGRLGIVLHDYAEAPLLLPYALTMNSYLNIVSETGIVGCIGLALLLASAVGLFRNSVRASGTDRRLLPVAVVAGVASGLVSWAGLDNFLHFHTWLMVAVVGALTAVQPRLVVPAAEEA